MWSEISSLLSEVGFPSVSIYLPTHERGPGVQQGRIRLKNLLRAVEGELEAAGVRRPEVASLLAEARDRVNDVAFWDHQSRGLALFVRPGHTTWRKLPIEVRELSVVGHRYHLRPLVEHLSRDDRYLVLALSQGGTRLFEATTHTIVERTVEGLPSGVDELRDRIDFDDDLGSHANSRGAGHRGRDGGAAGVPQFHALGQSPEDYADVLLEGFVSETAKAVDAALQDTHLPLVVAGGPKVTGRTRKKLEYRHVVPEALVKNLAPFDDEAIRAETWPIVEPLLRAGREGALRQLDAADGAGAADLDALAQAAISGRIEVLFLDPDAHVWGRYDEASGTVSRDPASGPNNEDLLDFLAVRTLEASGRVMLLTGDRLERNGPASAVLRY